MTTNLSDARLKVYEAMVDILTELAIDEDIDQGEQEEIVESMSEVADLVLDGLQFRVDKVSQKADRLIIKAELEVPA